MPPLVVRLPHARALHQFAVEACGARSCFVPSEAEFELGQRVPLVVAVGAQQVELTAELASVEVDGEGRAGARFNLDAAAASKLASFDEALWLTRRDVERRAARDAAASDEEPPTDPEFLIPDGADEGGASAAARRFDAARGAPVVLPSSLRVDAPRPSTPERPPSEAAGATSMPLPAALRVDAALAPAPGAHRSDAGAAGQRAAFAHGDAARPSGPGAHRSDAGVAGQRAAFAPGDAARPSGPGAHRSDAGAAGQRAAFAPGDAARPSGPGAHRSDAGAAGQRAAFAHGDAARSLATDQRAVDAGPQGGRHGAPPLHVDVSWPAGRNTPRQGTPSPGPQAGATAADAAQATPLGQGSTGGDGSRGPLTGPRATPGRGGDLSRRAATGRSAGAPASSGPREVGLTALFPPPAPSTSVAAEGTFARLTERNAALGFPLSSERLGVTAHLRAQLPEVMPAAWLLGVELVRAAEPAARATLLSLCIDVTATLGGALDVLGPTSAVFVFHGLGAQADAVLAAAELRERLEVLADGEAEPPTLKLALTGSHLWTEPGGPPEGDGLATLRALLRRAAPGECHAARTLAHGASDLAKWASANNDMRLVSRRALSVAPPATVGTEPLLRLLDARLAGLERGAVAPIVITGPRRAGRTHLALELARRAEAQGCFVARTSSLRGDGRPLSAVVELLCQAAQVPFDRRHDELGPALSALRVAPERRNAVLALSGLTAAPDPFTSRQVADALRLALADLSNGRRRLLLFDGLDHADAASVAVFSALRCSPQPRELLVGFSTAAQAEAQGWQQSFTVPTLTADEVDAVLQACVRRPPAGLRDALLSRSGGFPGLVMDLLRLTISRGGLRPRGDALALEGAVPQVPAADLPHARLLAEGTRVTRLLEAVWLLGEQADRATVARVLPDATGAGWVRAAATGLIVVQGERATLEPGLERLLAAFSGSPAMAARCARAVAEGGPDSLGRATRVALLLGRADEAHRAAQQWKRVADRAIGVRDFGLAATAHIGLARELSRAPRDSLDALLPVRPSSWARAVCLQLALGDVEAAAATLDEGLAALPTGRAPDAELSLATVRVRRAQGRDAEARAALGDALTASRGLPTHALALAEAAATLEVEDGGEQAETAWHQALGEAAALGPLGPWLGEHDFRARVEARIGAHLASMRNTSRARTWLLSAVERYKAAGAPLHACRVMARLGSLATQEGGWTEAASWFRQAAATAEAAGDFLFEARQLTELARILAKLRDPSMAEVAGRAAGLAEALDWAEGARAMRALN
ncbi:MAG: AAA family ATPase [Myxococcaceae bacterium]|nr:AAA family ATPase [Myxococcaceae bacterium]